MLRTAELISSMPAACSWADLVMELMFSLIEPTRWPIAVSDSPVRLTSSTPRRTSADDLSMSSLISLAAAAERWAS